MGIRNAPGHVTILMAWVLGPFLFSGCQDSGTCKPNVDATTVGTRGSKWQRVPFNYVNYLNLGKSCPMYPTVWYFCSSVTRTVTLSALELMQHACHSMHGFPPPWGRIMHDCAHFSSKGSPTSLASIVLFSIPLPRTCVPWAVNTMWPKQWGLFIMKYCIEMI